MDSFSFLLSLAVNSFSGASVAKATAAPMPVSISIISICCTVNGVLPKTAPQRAIKKMHGIIAERLNWIKRLTLMVKFLPHLILFLIELKSLS